ncbi:MAG: hypothetical protein ABI720_06735 [Actinomycetes bacterium]
MLSSLDAMTLDDFLSANEAEVVDTQHAEWPGVRNLNLQDPAGNRWLAVLCGNAEAAEVAQREGRVLDRIQEFRPDLCRTVPRVIARIQYRGAPSHVLTDQQAVPIVDQALFAEFAFTWLTALWSASATVERPTRLGSTWLEQRQESRQPPGCKLVDEMLMQASDRIVGTVIVRTISHGCLCQEHMLLTDSANVWVRDWSGANEQSEPWFDLADAVLSLLGDRAPVVLSTTRRATQPSRYLLRDGLRCLAIDGGYWRDLLLLRLADRACSITSSAVPSDWLLQRLAVEQKKGNP